MVQAGALLAILAIANPAIGTGQLLQHETKVLAGHGWVDLGVGVVRTDHFLHHTRHKACFFFAVGGVGVARLVDVQRLALVRCGNVGGNALDARYQGGLRLVAQGA